MPKMGWLVDLVARAPARVQVKLLAAFLAIAMLLIMLGTVGLQVLSGVNERTEKLIGLQRKIEAYRQVQLDTISQLYSVSSALLSSDDPTLSSTLRQLNQFGYDVDRLQFVAKDEVELLGQFSAGLRSICRDRHAWRGNDSFRSCDGSAGDTSDTGCAPGRSSRAFDQPTGQQSRGGHGSWYRD